VNVVLQGDLAIMHLIKKHMADQASTKAIAELLDFLAKFIGRIGVYAAPFAKQMIADCYLLCRAPIPNPVKTAAFSPLFVILETQAVPEWELCTSPENMANAFIFDIMKSGSKTTSTSNFI
jgi:hypothetical protein